MQTSHKQDEQVLWIGVGRYGPLKIFTPDDPFSVFGKRLGYFLQLRTPSARARLTPSKANILHVHIPYRQWDGDIRSWDQHFGKAGGQVYPLDGREPVPSCNEVEVAKRLRLITREAYWVALFRAYPRIPPPWKPYAISEKQMPEWLKELHYRVRRRVSGLEGGIPNVVAWEVTEGQESALFVHCQSPREKLTDNQENWISAAIREGVSPSQFAVAVRNFT